MGQVGLRVAIVGFGKIARDQHVPAIAATDGVELAALVSGGAGLAGVPRFASLEAMLAADPGVDAVALCTPPQPRRALAEAALRAGKHVLLEKPPGVTVAEIGPLVALARERGRTLFATWHSRFAAGVEPARELLAGAAIRTVQVAWREDVRVWHPNQAWIWQPGGLGVFDPGINALSIVTRILPLPLFVTSAELQFPANRDTPIAASLALADAAGTKVQVELDWRQTGPQSWDITVETDAFRLELQQGGRVLRRDGQALVEAPNEEYPAIYRRFLALTRSGESDVDLAPLVHVADAFMLGKRRLVDAFVEAAP